MPDKSEIAKIVINGKRVMEDEVEEVMRGVFCGSPEPMRQVQALEVLAGVAAEMANSGVKPATIANMVRNIGWRIVVE